MQLVHIFVYGTLKEGQCRGDHWPVAPASRQEAWTLGALYDLGPYPALARGTDRVLGELWSFAPDHIPQVLRVLDEIEVTNQAGVDNEYDRVTLQVVIGDRSELEAQAYIFCDSSLLTAERRILPWFIQGDRCFAAWPRK